MRTPLSVADNETAVAWKSQIRAEGSTDRTRATTTKRRSRRGGMGREVCSQAWRDPIDMSGKPSHDTPAIQSLDRGLAILEAVAGSPAPVPLKQLTDLIGID